MRILFNYQSMVAFVEKDIAICRSAHQVQEFHFRSTRDLPALWQGIARSDLTFSWFGSLHAFFAVLFSRLQRKKSVVVAGGYDVVRDPGMPGYGLISQPHKAWCPLLVFRQADCILSVSQHNYQEVITNAHADPSKVKLVYHGFDPMTFIGRPGVQKEKVIVTIGGLDSYTIVRKGLGFFVETAAHMPSASFVHIGSAQESALALLRKKASVNVTFKGWLPLEQVLPLLNKASVYVQASQHEAFGCAIAEAMLCECVPVVSRKAAIPEVVGDCGVYVNLEPAAIAAGIDQALSSNLGPRARERIATLFPLEKRRRELLATLDEAMDSRL